MMTTKPAGTRFDFQPDHSTVLIMAYGPDLSLRRLGLLFLAAAMLMLLFGQTLLEPHLGRGLLFVFYWLICFGFTILAMLVALLDIWIVRMRARHDQEKLFKQATQPAERPESDDARAP
jgi:hypothetical protein